jgi:2-keto-3-deoxy-L-rhamnonate aldolase RhmA
MLAKENRVKQKLCDGQIALGFICRTLSPVVVELIGLAGFDFAWLDMEHTTADFSTIEHLCRAADAVGIELLVRVPDQNPSTVLRALETGAGIVNVPEVKNRAEAEAVVRAAKFAPQGERGMSGSTRGLRYGFGGSAEESRGALTIEPASGTIFASAHNGGIRASTDGGKSWQPRTSRLCSGIHRECSLAP